MSLSIIFADNQADTKYIRHFVPLEMPKGCTMISSIETVRSNKAALNPFEATHGTAKISARPSGERLGVYELNVVALNLVDFNEARNLALLRLGVENPDLEAEVLKTALAKVNGLKARLRWLLTGKL